MKKIYLLTCLITSFAFSQVINFPDPVFKAKLLSSSSQNDIAKNLSGYYFKIDANNDNEISYSEALQVQELKINTPFGYSNIINDLSGIENFTNIKKINCGGNNLTSVNLSNLTLLEYFNANRNLLTNINVSNLLNLKTLHLYSNSINNIVLQNNNLLEELWLSDNQLTNLDLTPFLNLKYVFIENNHLNNLNLSGLSNIIQINANNNSLTSIDLFNKPNLNNLMISNNSISTFNVSNLNSLIYLDVSFNPISNLNINGLLNLTHLFLNNTQIANIDASNSGVTQLHCENNPNLTYINVKNNRYSSSDPDMLFYGLKVTNNPNLQTICVDNGEQNNLGYFNYNTNGNVQVVTGSDCNISLQVNMSTEDFITSQIKLYPNPVKDILNIQFESLIIPNAIKVYNLLGQKMDIPTNDLTKINCSNLKPGCYILEVQTDRGKATYKFIKE